MAAMPMENITRGFISFSRIICGTLKQMSGPIQEKSLKILEELIYRFLNMKHTISALFLSPLLELKQGAPVNIYDPAYYLSTYSGDVHREEYANWEAGDFVLLEYSENLPENLVEHFQKHPAFVEMYEPQKGKRIFVFNLPKEVKQTYTTKVLAGKYSEADKKVVEKYFPNDPNHTLYGNRLVFDKSDQWRIYWENRGVSIPEDAEVYSRPLPKNEQYGYVKSKNSGYGK